MRSAGTAAALAVAAVSLLGASWASASDGGAPPRTLHWTLDGWVVGAEAARSDEEGRRLFLLLAPAGSSPAERFDELLKRSGSAFAGGVSFSVGGGKMMETIDERFDPGGRFVPEAGVTLLSVGAAAEEPVVHRTDLPADAMALAVRDARGAGADELLILGPGRADTLGPASAPLREPRTVLADPAIDPAGSCPRRGSRWLPRIGGETAWLARSGSLLSLRRGDPGQPWQIDSELALPRRVELRGGGMRLWSYRPRVLLREQPAATIFAWPARSIGRTRLRWQVIEAADDGSPATVAESWFRLDGPRFVVASIPLLVDGAPALAAWSFRADKISLFAKPRLEVFLAAVDRSRAGRPAVLRLEGLSGKKQSARPVATDIDRDGRDDLVLGYADGRRWRMEVYRQQDGGAFDPEPRRTVLKLERDETVEAWRLLHGGEATGLDGGLLLATSRRLLACPRSARARGGARLFKTDQCRATTRIHPKEEGTWLFGDYRWVDLNDDEVPELIWFSLSDGGQSWVAVSDFSPPKPQVPPPDEPSP